MKKLSLAVLAIILYSGYAHADFLFSTKEAFTNGSNTYDKFDIVSTNGTGTYLQVLNSLSALLPQETGIDSLQFVSPDTIVFAIREDATIQGTLFHRQDLILWNGTNVSLLFDGQGAGIPQETGLDAADITSFSPLTLSISLREDASLSLSGTTTLVSRNDAIHYVAGTGFTGKDFDSNANDVPAEMNLDVYHYVTGTQTIMSFDVAGDLPNGSSNLYNKSDIESFNPNVPATYSTYFSGISEGIPQEVNIDAMTLTTGTVVPVELSKFEAFSE
jgi:hypothetical protein